MKSRILVFIVALLSASDQLYSQNTNIFPGTGNVGIGTTHPIWPLTVKGAIAINGEADQVLHLRPDSGSPGYIYWAENGVAERGILGFDGGLGDLIYRSGAYNFNSGTERFRVTSNGFFGIGTASPLVALHVQGTTIIGNPNGNSYDENLRLPSSTAGYSCIAMGASSATSGAEYGQWSLIKFPASYGSMFGIRHHNTDLFNILTDGNIGIGVTTPQEKLSVNGKIRAKEIKVETANWPDYVFDESYQLPDLKETEHFIKTNKHLPGIPSAKEVEEHGVSLGEMNAKLLKKVEELTLYVIELKKENELIKGQLPKAIK